MGISATLDDAVWRASGASVGARERESARTCGVCRHAAQLAGVDERLAPTYRSVEH